MKHHIVIKTKPNTPLQPDLPYWGDLIEDRSLSVSNFLPAVDKAFKNHGLKFYATKEYPTATQKWTKEELGSGLDRYFRLILAEDRKIPQGLIKEISLIPQVEKVRRSKVGRVKLPVAKSKSLPQMKYSAAQEMIFLKEAHAYSLGDPSITIAVLDSGIEPTHPELQHAFLPGYDFVNIIDGAGEFFGDFLTEDASPEDKMVGHGTHVSGIIVGRGEKMPVGVVPHCKILPVRVLGALKVAEGYVGAGLVDNINTGIKWAVDQGADIINMSLGVQHSEGGLPHEEVVDYAKRKDVTIVAASGNDASANLYYPGALEHVLSIGAVDEAGQVASFSSFGKVSLMAPGTDIYSSYLNGDYAFYSGTSQAAPFVTGSVALLKSYAKKMGRPISDRQVKYLLKNTADRTSTRWKTKKTGYGKINLIDALKLLIYKIKLSGHVKKNRKRTDIQQVG